MASYCGHEEDCDCERCYGARMAASARDRALEEAALIVEPFSFENCEGVVIRKGKEFAQRIRALKGPHGTK